MTAPSTASGLGGETAASSRSTELKFKFRLPVRLCDGEAEDISLTEAGHNESENDTRANIRSA